MASTTTTTTTATADSTTTSPILPHAQPSAIKMDELLVSWLGSDEVYDNVLKWMEQIMTTSSSSTQETDEEAKTEPPSTTTMTTTSSTSTSTPSSSSIAVEIPPFYSQSRRRPPPPPTNNSKTTTTNAAAFPMQSPSTLGSPNINTGNLGNIAANTAATNQPTPTQPTPSGLPIYMPPNLMAPAWNVTENHEQQQQQQPQPQLQQPEDELQQDDDDAIAGRSSTTSRNTFQCPKDHCRAILQEILLEEQQQQGEEGKTLTITNDNTQQIPPTLFARITKEIAQFPSFFHGPLYVRILEWYNNTTTTTRNQGEEDATVLTLDIFGKWYQQEVEPYDLHERLFRLLRQPAEPLSNEDDPNNNNNNNNSCVLRDDFLPYIKALLNEHPGLEFLSNHAEFQEKYAVTVITRIFYSVNKCHSGRITARQLRRSDLLQALWQVDEEEDINKITRYFSYEHFYVLYCRFWELDHDRDYRITREDLLKYGDHTLSHMIVDRIFEAAPRPFGTTALSDQHREYLSYEDFIYFMLSEEDKANEISVRYWFQCVDVDGDGKLDNMELRSFYAVQLHRMQVMGHEMVPFEDMLCQMMDMIKPQSQEYLVTEDFLDPACQQVSGALFDALFNLNKYLMFEQRDPFVERQKREDEFETDWDRFACIDYNRLAMEEEAREDEQMEIDWVTEEDEDEEGGGNNSHHHHQPGVDVAASDMSHHGFDGPVTLEAPF